MILLLSISVYHLASSFCAFTSFVFIVSDGGAHIFKDNLKNKHKYNKQHLTLKIPGPRLAQLGGTTAYTVLELGGIDLL